MNRLQKKNNYKVPRRPPAFAIAVVIVVYFGLNNFWRIVAVRFAVKVLYKSSRFGPKLEFFDSKQGLCFCTNIIDVPTHSIFVWFFVPPSPHPDPKISSFPCVCVGSIVYHSSLNRDIFPDSSLLGGGGGHSTTLLCFDGIHIYIILVHGKTKKDFQKNHGVFRFSSLPKRFSSSCEKSDLMNNYCQKSENVILFAGA